MTETQGFSTQALYGGERISKFEEMPPSFPGKVI